MGKEDDILRLISQSPPHEAIVYLCHRAGIPDEKIANQHSEMPLAALLEDLNGRPRLSKPKQSTLLRWFPVLRENLQRKLGDQLQNRRLLDTYASLLHLQAGESCLKQYLSDKPLQDLRQWRENVMDILRVARAVNGDEGAFERLHRSHESRIKTQIIAKVGRNDVEELCSEARFEIWGRLC